MNRTWPAHLALIGANLLYGVNYAIAKYPMPDFVKPAGFVLIRVVVAGILFWLLHALVVKERIKRRDIPLLMLCGLCGVAANQLMFISGLNLTTEINASLMMVTTPVLVPLLAHFIIGERTKWLSVVGIMLGASGALLIIVFGKDLHFGSDTWAGDTLIFLNAASWALYLVIAKPLLKRYNAVTVIKWTFLFGFFVVAVFGFPAIRDVELSTWDWRVWTSIAFVVIGATFLAYLLNIFGLSRLSPSVVGIYIYSQPFIASVVAMFVSSDRLTWTKVIAAMLIFCGVMLVSGIGPFRNEREQRTRNFANMLHSMTGYGKSLKERNGKSIQVEMRCLNSRYCDLSVKLPSSFRSKDLEIRSLLTQELIRGKIDLMLTISGGTESAQINKALFKAYFAELSSLGKEVGADTSQLMATVMQLPEVIDSGGDELPEDEWAASLIAIKDSIDQVAGFRKREGSAMQDDLLQRLEIMRKGLAEVEQLDPKRHKQIRERIAHNLTQWLKEQSYDSNRFEQELLYYIEKIDVNEEIVRLRAHMDHFVQAMNEPGAEKGKMLGFITQEMGREVNTISSKANDAAMQKVVVGMKDELEKIKELLLNVL